MPSMATESVRRNEPTRCDKEATSFAARRVRVAAFGRDAPCTAEMRRVRRQGGPDPQVLHRAARITWLHEGRTRGRKTAIS
jgi:hypothetical protein